MTSVKRFSISLIYFSLVIAAAVVGYNLLNIGKAIPTLFWFAWIYFVGLSYITFRITHSAVAKDDTTFVTRVYSAVGIRFIFSIFPLIIYLLFSTERNIPFVISYLLLYLLFTSFEIYFLVVNLRPDFKKPQR